VKHSNDRILTTHAGSLPRPQGLRQLMWDQLEGKAVDGAALDSQVRAAVKEIVEKQQQIGIDVISDGEMGKIGFSNYVFQHYTGFAEEAPFRAADLADFPDLAMKLVSGGLHHVVLRTLEGPIAPRDPEWVHAEIEDFKAALNGADPDDAFIPAVTPGQVTFNFPNRYYPSHEAYLEAAATALRPEYKAIVDAGFNLQLDSPDVAMARHCFIEGTDLNDPQRHVEASIDYLNGALADLPPEKLRFHICWGNYGGPHHKDIELREIIEPLLELQVAFISVEGANPRHEHEWRVWQELALPDDKMLIAGVIDTKTNHVEHPQLVAERLERFAGVVGKERVIAGTDCGFETFVGANSCDPGVAWLKLEALVDGAALASESLW